ncbi:MAG: hypothetical protein MJD61_04725 [Proteobacteria bacterium]|nr:hypothetical protein [Pseudomonadota bacterium]
MEALERDASQAERAQPQEASLRARLRTLALTLLLCAWAIDALPARSHVHRMAKRVVTPVLTNLGLWQRWPLFAPNVDSLNSWLDAQVLYSDGSRWSWQSTDWKRRDWWETIITHRHMKVYEELRRDDQRGLWSPFCRYLARIAPKRSGGARPVQVVLTRHWWQVPPPHRLEQARARFSAIPPPREEFIRRARYHTENLE